MVCTISASHSPHPATTSVGKVSEF
ncbi:hypothetical protein PM8797T_21138 [Gimesia maris DSM 8797]|nr:hypothetical protein PM8797T_21138 [Gimesia maris DSM 8797]